MKICKHGLTLCFYFYYYHQLTKLKWIIEHIHKLIKLHLNWSPVNFKQRKSISTKNAFSIALCLVNANLTKFNWSSYAQLGLMAWCYCPCGRHWIRHRRSCISSFINIMILLTRHLNQPDNNEITRVI